MSLPFLTLRIRYAVAVDVLCILLAYGVSLAIRFEPDSGLWPFLEGNRNLLFLSLAVRLPLYSVFGLYHHLWRYASTRELRSILGVSAASTAAIFLLNFAVLPLLGIAHTVSRSVVLLDGLLNLGLLAASRLALRLLQERLSNRSRRVAPMFVARPAVRRMLVVGAGDAGARAVREMQQNRDCGMVPIGLVDDDGSKFGKRIHGVPVLGERAQIPEIARNYQIDEVLIAMPSASGTTLRELRRLCIEAKLPFRTLPSIHEVLDGMPAVRQLRELRIEDLLRRDPVQTDQAEVKASITGTCVLVTGAGGSIGSELCRQVAAQGPSLLVLLGRGEYSIFTIERELRQRFPQVPLKPVIADVRDLDRVMGVVGQHRPRTIYHAAAHKHVPLMEWNVEDAVTNNILGTRNVLRAAEEHDVERFVLISTDKAVNPTSVMGATKRVAEMLVQQFAARTGRRYVAVRFGNVLGSRGSAVPIFREQIAAGGPVTVTHPDMRRYFMTIPEAVQLVLQAAVLGRGGEIFMLDMGEPVRIVDLVHDLIELSGLRPGVDIEVEFTGIRPGEKLYEELCLDTEHYDTTPHDRIFVLRNGALPHGAPEQLQQGITQMAEAARHLRADEIRRLLTVLVPEFQPPAPTPAAATAPTRPADEPATATRS